MRSRSYLCGYPFFVALLLLHCDQEYPRLAVVRGDDSEYGSCDYPEETLAWANYTTAFNNCGCSAPPTCTECVKSSAYTDKTECANGCEYCNPEQTTCGQFKFQYEQSDQSTIGGGFLFVDIVRQYRLEWTYTRGRTGTVVYSVHQLLSSWPRECFVYVNDQECTSCYLQDCEDESILPEPVIDCTNIEAGATAGSTDVLCTGRSAGGFVSLDDSALNGVLSPLAIPYFGCQEGTAVLASAPSPGPSTMGGNSNESSTFNDTESRPPSDSQVAGNGAVDDSVQEPRSESKARRATPLILGIQHVNIQCILVVAIAVAAVAH